MKIQRTRLIYKKSKEIQQKVQAVLEKKFTEKLEKLKRKLKKSLKSLKTVKNPKKTMKKLLKINENS